MGKKGTKQAPKGFRPEAKKLWYSTQDVYDLGTDAFEVLRAACLSLTNFLNAQDLIQAEGMTVKSKTGVIKKHPAMEIVKAERAGFLQATKLLGLDFNEDDFKRLPGRPPGS